eukprot:SAG31_NODE_4869_length_2877_cov_1.648446_3_plen_84_part_00
MTLKATTRKLLITASISPSVVVGEYRDHVGLWSRRYGAGRAGEQHRHQQVRQHTAGAQQAEVLRSAERTRPPARRSTPIVNLI